MVRQGAVLPFTKEQLTKIADATYQLGHHESCTLLVPNIRKCTCNRKQDA